MYIISGNSRIDGVTLFGETRHYQNLPRTALRAKFTGGITAAQLQDMMENDWHLMDGEGEAAKELGVQSGFRELETHEAIFIKVDELEAENNELKQEVAAVSNAIPSLLKGKNDDTIVQLVKYVPEWTQGAYTIGEVRKDVTGYPKVCVQAHDSTSNPAWDLTVASLWAPYHAKSAEYALPWVTPTGAHDMYKANEYMVYTDDKTYKCLSDTAYSPAEYAQAWQEI